MEHQAAAPRLTPVMTNRKLQVLDFIEAFWALHRKGPSLNEIANACGTNKTRAREAVMKLEREGRIHRMAGVERGIRPVGAIEEAIRLLREGGFVVDEDIMTVSAPVLDMGGVTNTALLQPCDPGHDPAK